MIDRSEVGMLPISSLNAMEYCPRRFYYQFVQGEMLVNEFVLEGTLEHQRVHQAGSHRTGVEEIETTRMYLYSEALGSERLCRCDTGKRRSACACGVQTRAPGRVDQRSCPALRAGNVPGRTNGGPVKRQGTNANRNVPNISRTDTFFMLARDDGSRCNSLNSCEPGREKQSLRP